MKKETVIVTCATCGNLRELCGSCKIDGIQQPRICTECLIVMMQTGEEAKINDVFWIRQLYELGDQESLNLIKIRAEEKDATKK